MLAGLGIWCTRPGISGARSAEAFTDLGADVVLAPTLRIDPVAADNSAALAAAPDAIVALTSPNTVANFVRVCAARRPDGQPWPVYAIGVRTAASARECGLQVVGIAPRATAADFGPALLAATPQRVVLLPGSDRRSPALGALLRVGGREVVELEVQRTVPSAGFPAAVTAAWSGLQLIVAYSPSALAFAETLDDAGRARLCTLPVAALGPTTAARARQLNLPVVVEPAYPGESGLLGSISEWWSSRPG